MTDESVLDEVRELLYEVKALRASIACVRALTGHTYGGLPGSDYRRGYQHGVEAAKRALDEWDAV